MKRMILLVMLIGLSNYPAKVVAQTVTAPGPSVTNEPAHSVPGPVPANASKDKAKTSTLGAWDTAANPAIKPVTQLPSTGPTNQWPDIESVNRFSPTQIEAARAFDLIKLPSPSSRYDNLMWGMIYHQRDVSVSGDGEPNIFRTLLR